VRQEVINGAKLGDYVMKADFVKNYMVWDYKAAKAIKESKN
jgi:hypothetical protein